MLTAVFLTGCAGWQTKYQPVGKAAPSAEITPLVPPEHVEIYVGQYPEGFILADGVFSSDPSTQNEVFGEMNIGFKPANTVAFVLVSLVTLGIGGLLMMFPRKMTHDQAVRMLQVKASEMGANAVIAVDIPSTDNFDKTTWVASGTAVVMERLDLEKPAEPAGEPSKPFYPYAPTFEPSAP